MARPGFLTIRLSDQERSRYQSLADERGVSLSEWIRDGAMRQAESEENLRRLQEMYEGRKSKRSKEKS